MVISTDWSVPGQGSSGSHGVACLVPAFLGLELKHNRDLGVFDALDAGQDLAVLGGLRAVLKPPCLFPI